MWKSDEPVWVDQWPLPEERSQAAHTLVQEQLNSGQAMPSNPPWNSPIFIIKKKSGKCQLTQDLRKVKRCYAGFL